MRILILLFFSISFSVFAHQPKLINYSPSLNNPHQVIDPEISKAYYGELKGNAHYYKITSNEELLLELPKKGVTSICVVSPSFAIDCLETLEEIAVRFKDDFIKAGGKDFKYIPCLNDNSDHVALIEKLITLNHRQKVKF